MIILSFTGHDDFGMISTNNTFKIVLVLRKKLLTSFMLESKNQTYNTNKKHKFNNKWRQKGFFFAFFVVICALQFFFWLSFCSYYFSVVVALIKKKKKKYKKIRKTIGFGFGYFLHHPSVRLCFVCFYIFILFFFWFLSAKCLHRNVCFYICYVSAF